MQLEFLDETPPGDVPPDAGQSPPWLRPLGGTLAAALLILVVVVVVNRRAPAPKPPAPVAAPTRPVTFPPLPRTLVGQDETFGAVYLRATDALPAGDVARSGSNTSSCRQVAIGTSPQRRAGQAITQALPGFHVLDTARIIDQSAGLCSLQVRARTTGGTVAVVIVTSPNVALSLVQHPDLSAGEAAVGSMSVEYARFLTRDGWAIVVGATGPPGRQPARAVLEQLAVDPALRW